VSALAVTIEVQDRANWAIDWKLLPVRPETRELSIEIGEVAALQKRVVGKADTGDNMARTERNLIEVRQKSTDETQIKLPAPFPGRIRQPDD
jgi:hypothetical protein